MSDVGPDRRSEPRAGWWFPVQLRTGATTVEAVCRDVSGGGMLVAVADPLAEDTAVIASFHAPGLDAARSCAGKVVRCRDNDDAHALMWPYLVGIAWDEAHDDLAALDPPAADDDTTAPGSEQ